VTRNEFTLLFLLIGLAALALFATVGFELHHLAAHLFDRLQGPGR
jgi:hypothetical protein